MNAYFVATKESDILVVIDRIPAGYGCMRVYEETRLLGVYIAETRGQAKFDFLEENSADIDLKTSVTVRLLAKDVDGERGRYGNGPLWDLVAEAW